MPLATVYDVLEETGADYDNFGFTDSVSFDTWIEKRIDQVDIKIMDMVGTYYTDADAIPDLLEAEISWVYYKMLKRKESIMSSSIESGFALGSLRIDSMAGPTERLGDITNDYFRKARVLLERYTNMICGKYLVVEDLDE